MFSVINNKLKYSRIYKFSYLFSNLKLFRNKIKITLKY